jgi:hypothetical protein
MADRRMLCTRFVLRNEYLNLEGLTEEWDYSGDRQHPIEIRGIGATGKALVHEMPHMNFDLQSPLDMTPHYRSELRTLEDMFPFIVRESETIIIERQADMGAVDMLQGILASQKGKQDEIFKRRKRDAVSEPEQQLILRVV